MSSQPGEQRVAEDWVWNAERRWPMRRQENGYYIPVEEDEVVPLHNACVTALRDALAREAELMRENKELRARLGIDP